MGLFLCGLGTFFGIMAVVWLVNSAFADGGILGILGLIVWFFFVMWIARESYNNKEE